MKKLSLIISMILVLAIASGISVSAVDMYVEKELTPIVSVEAPIGGGNKDLAIIQDGILEGNDHQQYDTYCGRTGAGEDFVGYTFPKPYTVKEFVFTEGKHFNNGGWFEMGMVRIEILKNGEWIEVESTSDPEYPAGLSVDDYGDWFETYTFTIDPVECDGIRIAGMAGGSASFISVAEVQVLAEVAEGYVVVDAKAQARAEAVEAERAEGYINSYFVPSTNITSTIGGSNHDINVINDSEWCVEGVENYALQYDTYSGATEYHDVWFGYDFGDQICTVTQVDFHEGTQFGNGGWYSNGIKVQALVKGEWIDVAAACTPEYPVSDVPADHLPAAQIFSFTFDAVDCSGIRIIGQCSGDAYFCTISELRVKGTIKDTSAEEVVVEEAEEIAEEVVDVVVEEAVVEEVKEEAPAAAPQTFDFGVIAAVLALLASAGCALIGKRR